MDNTDRLGRAEASISHLQRNIDDLALCIQQVSTGMAFLVARIARNEGQITSERLAGDATRQLCQLRELHSIYNAKYPNEMSTVGKWTDPLAQVETSQSN